MRQEMMGFGDGSGISWTICKQSALRSRQMTTPTPHHPIFTGRMLFLTPMNHPTNSVNGRSGSKTNETSIYIKQPISAYRTTVTHPNTSPMHKIKTFTTMANKRNAKGEQNISKTG